MAPRPTIVAFPAEVQVRDIRARRFCLPGYTEPPPHGRRIPGFRALPGDRLVIVALHSTERFVSALTEDGVWVNLWTLYNLRGEPVGVLFADILGA